MRPVTLRRISDTSQIVMLADGWTAASQPGAPPAHHLPSGDALIGVEQMRMDEIIELPDGSFFVLPSDIRQAVEAPIYAAAAQYHGELMTRLNALPWWRRVWLALRAKL